MEFIPPGTKLLKLKCDTLLSNFAFEFNLRRYNEAVRFDDELSLRGHMSATAPEKHGPKYRLYAMAGVHNSLRQALDRH